MIEIVRRVHVLSQLEVAAILPCDEHRYLYVPSCAACRREDYGVTSYREVTDVGVAYIVDAFQGLVTLSNMKYHGIGTNNTAEDQAQTALIAELTTQYSPTNSTRATGTQTEGSANEYVTVGLNFVDASVTIEEHGLFSAATVGSGVMLDRSLVGGIALTPGQGIQTTYTFTLTAGS